MPKINQEEYEALKGLDDRWKWVARDKGGGLYIYEKKPKKLGDEWTGWRGHYLCLSNEALQFIQWEDEEAHNIAELMGEYKSEDREVKKDVEWLRKKVLELKNNGNAEANQTETEAERERGRLQEWALYNCVDRVCELIDQLDEPETNGQIDKLANFIMSEVEGEPSQSQGAVDTAIRIIKSYQNQEALSIDKEQLIKRIENYIPLHDKTVGDVLDGILEIIKQLPELEVLSRKWIDEHAQGHWDEWVYIDDLQNLLVPKREKVKVPRFMADYLPQAKQDTDLKKVIYDAVVDDGLVSWVEEYYWIRENLETFIRAWLDGFEVEKEPLYRARLKVVTYKGIDAYLRTQSSSAEERLKSLEIGSKYIHEDYRHLSEFTEEELKGLNIWDSDQWEIEQVEG